VFTAMAQALGAPPPRTVPRWLFRITAPYVASFAVDTSMRVSNVKATTELDWSPMFPTYRDGIDAMATSDA
jgi:nucleoside-diphosphate-sugar epimerase